MTLINSNQANDEPSSTAPEHAAKVFKSAQSRDLTDLIAKQSSLGQYLLDKLNGENKDNILFTDFNSARQWTGAQLYEKILNVSAAMIDRYHVEPGMAACVSYDNTDEAQILAIGLICAGVTVACSYPKDPYAELLYLAQKIRPKFLFCHEINRIKWGDQLSADLGYRVTTISMDDHNAHDNLYALFDYDRTNSLAQIPAPIRDIKKHVALITMSSGTTGKPKAVPMTHYNCLADLITAYVSKKPVPYNRLSFACCASLDYVSGRLIIFGAINLGYNCVILNGFEPESYARAIEKFRINIAYIGAASFYNFITWPGLDKHDISSLDMIFPMGAKVIYLKELGEFLKKHPHIKQVRQGYGSSETSGVAMNSLPPSEYLKDSENCGPLMPGCCIKIVDPINGQILGPNKVGIVHVRGDVVFPGYYDREFKVKIKTREVELNGNNEFDENTDDEDPFVCDSSVFDEDNFYISGDLGYMNEKEELYIIGRQKELMSCRGAKKVLPQELEEILDKHPAVNKVCVLGLPHKRFKLLHCPRAFVVPKEIYLQRPELIDQLKKIRPKMHTLNDELENHGQPLKYTGNADTDLCSLPRQWRRILAEDLMAVMNERVGWEKQLTGGLILLDEIPTSRATGKMDKNYLRALKLDTVEIYGDQSE